MESRVVVLFVFSIHAETTAETTCIFYSKIRERRDAMKPGYNRRMFLSTYELQMSQSAVRLPTGYSASFERWFLDTSRILDKKECNMINLRYYKKNKFAVLIDSDGLSGAFAKIIYDRLNEIGIFSKAYLFLSRKNTRIKEWTLLANLYGFEPIMTGNLITPKRAFHKVKKRRKIY